MGCFVPGNVAGVRTKCQVYFKFLFKATIKSSFAADFQNADLAVVYFAAVWRLRRTFIEKIKILQLSYYGQIQPIKKFN